MSTTSERFEDFNEAHPEVAIHLMEQALKVKAAGFTKYSIKTLYCVARWHFQFDKDATERYKLPDELHSRYARYLMENCPQLSGFFVTRELRTL